MGESHINIHIMLRKHAVHTVCQVNNNIYFRVHNGVITQTFQVNVVTVLLSSTWRGCVFWCIGFEFVKHRIQLKGTRKLLSWQYACLCPLRMFENMTIFLFLCVSIWLLYSTDRQKCRYMTCSSMFPFQLGLSKETQWYPKALIA